MNSKVPLLANKLVLKTLCSEKAAGKALIEERFILVFQLGYRACGLLGTAQHKTLTAEAGRCGNSKYLGPFHSVLV